MASAVTYPDTLEMIVGEQLDLTVDFTNVIGVGDSISHGKVAVTNLSNDEVMSSAVVGPVTTTTGNILKTTLSSINLRPRTDYLVSFTTTVAALDAAYFETILGDNPLHYYRANESASPFHDYGSLGLDGVAWGSPTLRQAPLVTDRDYSIRFVGSAGINVPHFQRGNGLDGNCGPINIAWEAWIYPTGEGPNYPGFGNASEVFVYPFDTAEFPSAVQELRVHNGVDLYWGLASQPFAGASATGGGHVLGSVSIGSAYHVVLKYLAGDFQGDGIPITTTGVTSLWVNANKIGEWVTASFRPFIFQPSGRPPMHMQIGHFLPFDTGDNNSDIIIDEFAVYGDDTIGGDPLPDARIAAHYATGITTSLPTSFLPVPPGGTPATSLVTINLLVKVIY